jgi:glycosyltransferase involved in cell wall biosynthesis
MRVLRVLPSRVPPFSEIAEQLQRSGLAWKLLPCAVADGLAMFARRNGFDAVITEHYQATLCFGFLTRLFGRRCRFIVKELYLDESVLRSKFSRWLCRHALARVDLIITNASCEIQAYSQFLGLPEERFAFIPWPANILPEPQPPGDYIFAAGRSMRDWRTFMHAVRALDCKCIVVASKKDIAELEVPPNVTVFTDIPHHNYMELMRRSWLVVVPLISTVRSTGQAVVLEAMAMGKPVIATKTAGFEDYIRDGETGILCEPCELRTAIQSMLDDFDLRLRLGRAGLNAVQTTFNKPAYSAAVCRLLFWCIGCRESRRSGQMCRTGGAFGCSIGSKSKEGVV